MKSEDETRKRVVWHVAPLVGAWIEIEYIWTDYRGTEVAPLVGAWIEILSRSALK